MKVQDLMQVIFMLTQRVLPIPNVKSLSCPNKYRIGI
ncbi:hypothetical protein CPS_3748 [Colwellia psychrerythraea 34H]|uniref:Uncharacterized protein n=1 Tax=Colwellia psychrerythraea (strain 34H / ATCC BAA-681) TaxID=167879 RepID=Q47XQ5_COLP3|nr:hypothetical protein CPS_3748 [Colwellia psychrerythraea 34H]